MRRLVLLLLPVVFLLGSACSCGDDGTRGQAGRAQIEAPRDPEALADHLLSFGAAWVGETIELPIVFRNVGDAPLLLHFEAIEGPFTVAAELSIPVGGAQELSFRYQPQEEGSASAIASATDSDGKRHSFRLVGEAFEAAIDCEPNPVSFGPVPRGTATEKIVSCSHRGPIPLELRVGSSEGASRAAFGAHVREDEGVRGMIPPEGALELRVLFRADAIGEQSASLPLFTGWGQRLLSLPLLAEGIAGVLAVEPSDCLSFGDIPVGERSTRSLQLINSGSSTRSLLGIAVEEERSFSIATELPLELAPGEQAAVEVEFHPERHGPIRSRLELLVADAAPISACANGRGGAPGLRCVPEVMDFGLVAIGAPIRKELRCVYEGPPEGEGAPLLVEGIHVETPAFLAQILGDDGGSAGPDPLGYVAGEPFFVQIIFAPTQEGLQSGTLTIDTDLAGELEIPLLGEGRELPPCEVAIEPPAIRFGTIEPGAELVQTLSIRNLQGSACVISDLRLEAGSSPAFSIEPRGSTYLEGFEKLKIPVRFAPSAHGTSKGAIRFQISAPDASVQRVELSGDSSPVCLVLEPSVVDFGGIEPGCRSGPKHAVLRSLCGANVVLEGLEIGGSPDADSFRIDRIPSLPMVLGPGDSLALPLRFQPAEEGGVEAALQIATRTGGPIGGEGALLVQLVGRGEESPMRTDRLDWAAPPKVDILWVSDASGSGMVIQSFPIFSQLSAFLSFLMERELDFNLATISGGTEGSGGCGTGVLDGRFYPLDSSTPRILTRRTPGLQSAWSANVQAGSPCGGNPSFMFESARRALSKPLIDEIKSSKHNSIYVDGNAGFLREDASLVIVFASSATERSHWLEPMEYLDFFRSLKGDPSQVVIHAISGPPTSRPELACAWVSAYGDGDRFLELVQETGGHWINICTPAANTSTWRPNLEAMVQRTVEIPRRLYLSETPSGPIEVRLDGEPLPETGGGARIWSYDQQDRAIDFAPLYAPPYGSEVSATYRLACLREEG